MRPGVMGAAIVGLVLAFIGSVLQTIIPAGSGLTVEALTSLLTGIYVLYLLSQTSERTGRVTSFLVWSATTVALTLSGCGLTAMLVSQVLMISALRALYFHNGVLPVLLDGALSFFALAAAVWAFVHSGSLFLAIWTFFLVQAAFVLIPACRSGDLSAGSTHSDSTFTQSHRAADQAINRLAAR
jgi:hypothetical protein